MIRILTLVNTGVLIGLIGGGAFVYFQRGKITDSIMSEVQKQLPSLVKGAMPKISVPSSTGNVLPF
tara:strand:- start:197 stop:394 length:198 start_codon:yes stop_codon:yes gene_type:complete